VMGMGRLKGRERLGAERVAPSPFWPFIGGEEEGGEGGWLEGRMTIGPGYWRTASRRGQRGF
jgi:hypothetical protein